MPVDNNIRSYSNAIDLIKSHSTEVLEVNKDGSLRTQTGLEKLKLLGSRLVGNYNQVKQQKDATVGNAITALWANAVASQNRGAKGHIPPLLQANGKSNIYLSRFLNARNEVANSAKGNINTRAKDATVIPRGAQRPTKATTPQKAAELGRGLAQREALHGAQLKAIRTLSQALTDFATSDAATTDQGIAALKASQRLDHAAEKLAASPKTKNADWGREVIAPLTQNGFVFGKGALADFGGLSGAADNAKKILDWANKT
jgi:hypothetical protein